MKTESDWTSAVVTTQIQWSKNDLFQVRKTVSSVTEDTNENIGED